MSLRSLRLLPLVLTTLLCLGHAETGGGGCGGSSSEDNHHAGSPSGATCPPSGAPTAQDFGRDFLDRYCQPCHAASVTGPARQGAPEGMHFDTLEEVRRLAGAIDTHAAAGPSAENTQMPPASSPRPSPQERERLGQWLACGAP